MKVCSRMPLEWEEEGRAGVCEGWQAVEVRGSRIVAAAGLPLTDRGFRYGQHVFETWPVRRGEWHFYERHIGRLFEAGEALGFPAPGAEEREALRLLPGWFADWRGRDGVGRLYWTAGDGPPGGPVCAPRLFCVLEEAELPQGPLRLRLGVAVAEGKVGEEVGGVLGQVGVLVVKHRLFVGGGVSCHWGLKTGNYWSRLRVLEQARRMGADEALIFDENGRLVSACLGNVFCRLDGRWVTPPGECGARRGVAREWLMRELGVREGDLGVEQVVRAEGVIVCNSRMGPACGVLAGIWGSGGRGGSSTWAEGWGVLESGGEEWLKTIWRRYFGESQRRRYE